MNLGTNEAALKLKDIFQINKKKVKRKKKKIPEKKRKKDMEN